MSRVHAKLSPSSAERWFNCPGVINLINRLIDEGKTLRKSGIAAAEGTVAHSLGEALIQNKADVLSLSSRVGEVVMQEGFEVEISDAMIEGVIEYVDHVAAVRRGMKVKPSGIKGEAEVELVASSVDTEVYGFADYVLYQKGDELHVFDFKFGKGVVPAEENKQGLIYILGAIDRLNNAPFDKVAFHIVQPRRMDGGEAVDTWVLPKGRVEAFRVELREAIARTRDPKAPLNTGAWCKFCPAEAYCPEKTGQMEKAVNAAFTKLPMPVSKEAATGALPPVALMTVEQVFRAMDYEDAVDSWFEAVRERARVELARDPNCTRDYKLVEGRKNRVWADDAQADTAFAMLGEKRYAPRKLLSPAQMEKFVSKDEVAKYAHKPTGELTVAKASDKRQGVSKVSSADAQAIFGGEPPFAPREKIDLDGDAPAGLFADLEPKKEPFQWP